MFVAYRSVVNISVCGHVHKWRFYSRIMQHLHEEEYRQAKYLAGLPIVHHEKYVCPLPPNHRFKMMKFHYLYEILLRDGVIKKDKQMRESIGLSHFLTDWSGVVLSVRKQEAFEERHVFGSIIVILSTYTCSSFTTRTTTAPSVPTTAMQTSATVHNIPLH
ncbi:uncharacterized protein E2C01_007984 [Portunus trituberculatus]|uniref:Uncharacterized protein n=1 Tax=Portunus trituberculatus TaxID=210409 RepID=A0A5B7D0K9_PORTR|nr:uncharacterized protein [Portunus trituberculatus]